MPPYREVRQRITSACHRGLELRELFDATERALRGAVQFDGCCWLTLDPATYLPTSHIAHDSIRVEDVPRLARNEILEDDVNKLAELARARQHAGILSEATGGAPERSARYRDLLRPNGFEAELRVAFVEGPSAWGGMAMYRRSGRADFARSERGLLANVSGLIAEGIRRTLLLAAVRTADEPADIGLILLEPGGATETVTPAARRWLDQLITPSSTAGELPNVVHAVAYRALLAARSGAEGAARSRVPTASGRWVVLHGSAVGPPEQGRTAVIIEPARAPEMAPLIVEAYGLTAREREVAQLVLQGRATDGIAVALHVSPHTVQDHLKAIFEKVGVHSRRELVAQVFFQNYAPRISDGAALGATGWFATTGARSGRNAASVRGSSV